MTTLAFNSRQDVISAALKIMEEDAAKYATDVFFTSHTKVKDYLKLRLSWKPKEVFLGCFLTTQYELIETVELASGTIDAASVFPREVVKEALRLNAAAVVFAHNHPSGDTTPSPADRRITERLTSAMDLIGVRVLDHIIIGRSSATSFAEKGLL